jgi:hypothetical protein
MFAVVREQARKSERRTGGDEAVEEAGNGSSTVELSCAPSSLGPRTADSRSGCGSERSAPPVRSSAAFRSCSCSTLSAVPGAATSAAHLYGCLTTTSNARPGHRGSDRHPSFAHYPLGYNMSIVDPAFDVRTLGGVCQQVRHEVEGLRREAAACCGARVRQARQQQPHRRVARPHHGAGCQVRACSADGEL